jgi:hypothetical protein
MPPRKKAADKSGTAATERTSTTRGKTFQEVTGESGPTVDPATGEESKGYYGATPDDTPNENYTVSGVLADKPVPETETE